MKTQIEMYEGGEWQVIRDESGNAAGVCSGGANTVCQKYSWISNYAISNRGRTVEIQVREGDFNAFSNKLADDVTFRFRVRTRDLWSTDASNPLYQTLNITMTH